MTQYVLEFLREVKEQIGAQDNILEVGALNVNGSAREVFEEDSVCYTGIDLEHGEGVDYVSNIQEWNYEGYDLIICCETLEHDPTFWLSIEKMKDILKPGGWLVITTPGFYFPEHNYPKDYYRFMPETYRDVFFKGMKDVTVTAFTSFGGSIEKPDWVGGYAQK